MLATHKGLLRHESCGERLHVAKVTARRWLTSQRCNEDVKNASDAF
jgi:hypothetical protein